MSKAALYDATKCIGCRSCQSACGKENNLPAEETLTRIRVTETGGRKVYTKIQCMHCQHPACAEACPVGAMQKTPEGPVIYDKAKCFGCRYCMVACPFGIPTFEWGEAIPWVRKCQFCAGRQAKGLEPACVVACPAGALKFGDRDSLILEARDRITGFPDKYVNHIYGETELGGTSWLYLSPVDFKVLGLPDAGAGPVTMNVERAMGSVPPALLGVAAVMSGVYWVIRRRQKMMQPVPVKQRRKEVTG